MFLQKPAQQNILQYEGQIFKEMILYLQRFLHTLLLAASLSLNFSVKMRSDKIVPSNWGNALFGSKPSAANQNSFVCGIGVLPAVFVSLPLFSFFSQVFESVEVLLSCSWCLHTLFSVFWC